MYTPKEDDAMTSIEVTEAEIIRLSVEIEACKYPSGVLKTYERYRYNNLMDTLRDAVRKLNTLKADASRGQVLL